MGNAHGSSSCAGEDSKTTDELLFEHVVSSDTAREKPYSDSNGKRLNRGDILAFNRGTFDHIGMYTGKGTVTHVVVDSSGDGLVRVQTLGDVRGKSKFTVRNRDKLAMDKYKANPRSFPEIVEVLKPIVGKKVNYEILKSNCEHYATLWRYGKSFSPQVAQVQKAATATAVVAAAVTAVTAPPAVATCSIVGISLSRQYSH